MPTEMNNDNAWFFSFLNELIDSENGIKLDDIKDLKDIKKSIEIIPLRQGMIVYALAISKTGYNTNVDLYCKKGKPISNTCYNVVKDSCCVECCDYLEIGPVAVNYVIKFKDSSGYIADIPLPESLLKRYLSDSQKQKITSFKNKYKDVNKYCVKYFQILKASPK